MTLDVYKIHLTPIALLRFLPPMVGDLCLEMAIRFAAPGADPSTVSRKIAHELLTKMAEKKIESVNGVSPEQRVIAAEWIETAGGVIEAVFTYPQEAAALYRFIVTSLHARELGNQTTQESCAGELGGNQ
jgi:hypothetical protein